MATTSPTNRLIFAASKLFSVCKYLGLFSSRPSQRIAVKMCYLVISTFQIVFLSFQTLLCVRKFVQNTKLVVMDLVYQGYAICSLLATFFTFWGHFRSLLNRNFLFFPLRTRHARSNLPCYMAIYLFVASTKIFALLFVLAITRSDNIIGLVTFITYVWLSVEEILIFLILSQMYSMCYLIASSIDRVKTSTSSIQTKFERLMKYLEMSSSMNRYYERQILFAFFYLWLEMVNSGYYTCMYLLVRPELLQYRYFFANCITNILVVVATFVLLSVPVIACERINEAVNAFYEELFTIVRKSDELCRNKKLCLYLTVRRSVNFSACGYFNLGYPLIASIIAASTTYLVILVQFSNDK